MRVTNFLGWCVAILFSASAVAADNKITAKKLMTAAEFKASGLDKLSDSEMQELDKWLGKHTLNVYRLATGSGSGGNSATIEKAINDQTFIIAGKVFEAKTFCIGTMDGDNIQFTEGRPGICFSAKFVNLRSGQVCDVWCK
jgi:hypothetical protein